MSIVNDNAHSCTMLPDLHECVKHLLRSYKKDSNEFSSKMF